ncbi:MAG: hypothetical protein LQ352_005498 [Teloschistes flavicans]|nr:MAG: hypothetical protein LQ352_005498 [Teloschistes flavicans]
MPVEVSAGDMGRSPIVHHRQTYEGGVSSSPQTEAHGAYAFCALACLSILGPPHDMIPRYHKLQDYGDGTTLTSRI